MVSTRRVSLVKGLFGARHIMARASIRSSLAARAVVFTALLVALTAAGVGAAAYWVLSEELATKARADIEVNLRILALTYAQSYPDATITLDGERVVRAEIAAIPSFTDDAVVDRTAALIGGNATIFAYDAASDRFVRRTTNLKKENGERAVGTELAADHPGQVLLRRGEPYRGPALLFGQRFFTAYQPIFAAGGKLIGIFYVGTPIQYYDNIFVHAISDMSIVAGLGALLVASLTIVLVRRSLRPLTVLARSLTQLAEGDLDAEVEDTHRTDEIGAIASGSRCFATRCGAPARWKRRRRPPRNAKPPSARPPCTSSPTGSSTRSAISCAPSRIPQPGSRRRPAP